METHMLPLQQQWSSYTPDDHRIWQELYAQQMELLASRAAPEIMKGRDALGIVKDQIPDLQKLNEKLYALTGWQVAVVDGLVDDEQMFVYLSQKLFPACRHIRAREEMEYSPGPDIFHDVFGHVPMLTNPSFAQYVHAYGVEGLKAKEKGHMDKFMRLYFYTVEFGLIKGQHGLRIYGSGLTSSKSEAVYALESELPERLPFSVEQVIETPVHNGSFQPRYFVIERFEQLPEAMRALMEQL